MKKILLFMFALLAAVTTAFAQTNLLENGDFESWTDGTPDNWKTTSSAGNAAVSQSTTAHGGSYSAQVATAVKNRRMAYKEITLAAGTYTFSFWIRTADGSDSGSACIGYAPLGTDGKVGTYSYKESEGESVNGDWAQFTYEFTLDEETTICPLVMVKKSTVDVLVDDATLTTSDGGETDPVDPGTGEGHSNTAETAYTVAKAHELIAAGQGLDTEVYVKGIVTSVSSFNSSYGSITYYLGDTEEDANPLQIYGGLYYNGDMFSSINDLAEGDEIVVKGLLKSYNGTDEMDKNNVVITHKRNGEDVTPSTPSVDITNTPEHAYSVADAIKLIDDGEGLTTKVYVKGYIVGTPSVSTSYGNATYTISDTEGDETTTLTVYRGYYLENAKFTSEDQIAAGDMVVVYGTLTLYGSKYEINSGNYIYSKNGSTTAISNAVIDNAASKSIYSLDGRRLAAPVKGVNIINGKKVVVK